VKYRKVAPTGSTMVYLLLEADTGCCCCYFWT